MRKTLNVIRSECEGSVPVVRKAVRCHQNHRFFTLCHCPVSRLSHTAFLPPFWMTISGKHVTNDRERKTSWWRRTKGVILSGSEGSVTLKPWGRKNRRPVTPTVPFPVFSTQHSCLRSEWRFWESTSLTMGNGKRHDDGERKASSKANAKDLYLWWGKLVRRHPERMWRIYYP